MGSELPALHRVELWSLNTAIRNHSRKRLHQASTGILPRGVLTIQRAPRSARSGSDLVCTAFSSVEAGWPRPRGSLSGGIARIVTESNASSIFSGWSVYY